MKSKHIIKVGEKSYGKSLHFGNRESKVVFKSRVKYSRKNKHGIEQE